MHSSPADNRVVLEWKKDSRRLTWRRKANWRFWRGKPASHWFSHLLLFQLFPGPNSAPDHCVKCIRQKHKLVRAQSRTALSFLSATPPNQLNFRRTLINQRKLQSPVRNTWLWGKISKEIFLFLLCLYRLCLSLWFLISVLWLLTASWANKGPSSLLPPPQRLDLESVFHSHGALCPQEVSPSP